MDEDELMRTHHRPDWWQVFLGVTFTFALMGAFSLIGLATGAYQFKAGNSISEIVVKCLFLITTLVVSSYFGGYLTGFTLHKKNRVIAAMDGLLVWELTVVLFAIVGWFGFDPLPGISLERNIRSTSDQGILYLSMMLCLPIPFAALFGAMRGNDHAVSNGKDQSVESQDTKQEVKRAA